MPLSMSAATLPHFVRALQNLAAILDKGAAHAAAKGIEEASLTSFRLYPDMLPLYRQVHIACDMVKNAAARLAGREAPKFDDVETSFPELQQRIAATLDYLQSFDAAAFDGSEDKAITVPMRTGALEFTGAQYVFAWVLPNLHFHCSTAYNILRHNGVELGKMDYLGKVA